MLLPDAPAIRPTEPNLDALATALARLLLESYRRRIADENAGPGRADRENPATLELAGGRGRGAGEAAR